MNNYQYYKPNKETKEITLTLRDYNLLFSALRDAQYNALDKYQDDETNQVYSDLVDKFSKFTQTMNWLVYQDEVVIGIKNNS